MRCEDREELLVASLYGELSAEEEELVERHLASCAACREEWETLSSTAGLLRRWEDMESPVRYRMAEPSGTKEKQERRSSRSSRSRGLLRRLGRLSAPACVAAAAALLLVIFNASFSVEDGRLSVSFGRQPAAPADETAEAAADPGSFEGGVPLGLPVSADVPRYVTRDDFLQSQGELIRFVATLIRESEDRQMENVGAVLKQYLQEAEIQRETDMGAIGAKVDEVERSAHSVLQSLAVSDDAVADTSGEEGAR